MPADVLFRQRLLDQQQVELVELREPLAIEAGVCGVRIYLEEDVSESFADRAHGLEVLSRLDFELDPAVALFEVALDSAQELVHVLVDADRDTAVDLGASAAEVLAEGDSLCAELSVEDRHLERALRHRVPTHALQRRRNELSGHVVEREQPRQQVLANHVVGAADVLVRVERLDERDTLAPALRIGADYTDEQDFALAHGAE